MESRALFLVVSLIAVTLAGCTEPTDTADGAIKILGMPADPKTEAVRLEATVTADEYKWKMGDGRPMLTTKSIEHIYGVSDGKFRVELTTVKGGESTIHAPLNIEFGTGQNSAPSFLLELENNWVQVGEEVTLSAAGSTDAENDPLLLQWFCQRKSDIVISTEGGHPPPPGVAFGSGSAAAFPVQVMNGTDVPAADRTVTGDLCENIGTGGFSQETGIRGAFATKGIYEITLAAKDPANPNVASTATLYVTDFARITEPVTHKFSDTIQYGAPEAADEAARQLEQTEHMRSHDFVIEFPILDVKATLSSDGGAAGPAADLQFQILKGTSSKHGPTAEPLDKGAGYLTQGSYTAWVYLRSGANVSYDLDITYTYVTDPAVLFEAPHA